MPMQGQTCIMRNTQPYSTNTPLKALYTTSPTKDNMHACIPLKSNGTCTLLTETENHVGESKPTKKDR